MDPAFDFYPAGTLEELPDIPRRPIAPDGGLPGILSEISPHKAGLRASLPADTLTIELSPSAPFGPTAAQLIERLLPDGPEAAQRTVDERFATTAAIIKALRDAVTTRKRSR